MLTDDTETPNFDTDAFRSNVTEVTGTNWASGGVAITGPGDHRLRGNADLRGLERLGGDDDDGGRDGVGAHHRQRHRGLGPDWMLHDFVTAVSTSAGTFGINWTGGQLATLDLTP